MFPAYFFGPGSTGGQWFPTGTIQHLANCTSVLTINQTRSGIYYQAAPEVNGQVTINISLSVVIRYSNCAAPLTTGTPCTTCGQDTATGGLIV